MEGWDLALRGEAAQAEGAFSLRLTPEEATRRLALDLNITQADALFLGAYLPEKLEAGLRGWLQRRCGAVGSSGENLCSTAP